MPTITEFLEARIAEDEQLAESASVSTHGERHESQRHDSSYVLSSERDSTEAQDEFILQWWPARVLSECAAKRAIIELADNDLRVEVQRGDASALGGALMHFDTLRTLAAVYKDHPDYQQEWAL